MNCDRCGRPIKNPRSMRNGVGPECFKKGTTTRLNTIRHLEQMKHQEGNDTIMEYVQNILDTIRKGQALNSHQTRFIQSLPVEDSSPSIRTLDAFS